MITNTAFWAPCRHSAQLQSMKSFLQIEGSLSNPLGNQVELPKNKKNQKMTVGWLDKAKLKLIQSFSYIFLFVTKFGVLFYFWRNIFCRFFYICIQMYTCIHINIYECLEMLWDQKIIMTTYSYFNLLRHPHSSDISFS